MRRRRGQTFGIVGFGRIGMAAARRAKGFDMDILFYDADLPNGVELWVGYRCARCLKDLMEACDTISLHAPTTQQTRHNINAESLSWARYILIFVNTAGGPLIDIDALHDALKSNRIAGAAPDVCCPPNRPCRFIRSSWPCEPVKHGSRTVSFPPTPPSSAPPPQISTSAAKSPKWCCTTCVTGGSPIASMRIGCGTIVNEGNAATARRCGRCDP